MRDEFKPGDLSARIAFPQEFSSGSGSGSVHPTIEITDGTSGLHLELQFTAEQLVAMLSGSEARVPAVKVSGYPGLRNWGKYLHTTTVTVEGKPGDYARSSKVNGPLDLPHVAQAVAQVEADGYRCDTPRRNNASKWVIVGRRYDEKP